MSKKVFLTLIVIVLVILVLGLVFVGGYSAGKKDTEKAAEVQTEALQSELEKFYPPVPDEVKRISGEALSIQGNIISVKTKIRVRRFPEAGQDVYDEMIKAVTVTSATEIYKIDRQGQITTEGGLPKISLMLGDIEVGDRIAVESHTDIKDINSFEAKAVELLF